ncbi:hypothetical protein [Spirosoma jeollabukense]
MINVDNPTPSQVAQMAGVQKRRLADLQQLPHWSNSQFEEVLFCMQTWSEEQQEWIHQVEPICQLAFDVRVPKAYADKLGQLINHWRDSGQLSTTST